MITIRDVARQAGVSVATVSRVLNNSALVSPDTRDVVMKAVTQLGYRPNANAQALATQVSDTIGVVVMDVSDAFFGALVKAVDTVAQQHQKYVLIGNSYHEAEKERHAIEVLIRQRCNALIVHSKALSDDELAQFMDSLGVKTAYNLDGGGSSTMYFNGEVINQPTTNGKSIQERSVSDIVYIGY